MKGARCKIALAALVVVGVCAAGATAGPRSGQRAVFYQLTAEFGLGLDVKWTWDEGSRASCSWTHREGTWEVDAGSVNPLPGSFSADPKVTGQQWAYLAAVGKAKVQVKRTLVQEGLEPRPTGTGCRNKAFPPTDCGRQEYTSRVATLNAVWRGDIGTLEGRTTEPARGRAPAIAVSVPPLRQLYRSCDLPSFVPQAAGIPGDIGFLVNSTMLGRLKPGQRYTYDSTKNKTSSGSCMKKLPERVTCTFTLDLRADIHRLTRKEILQQAKKGR